MNRMHWKVNAIKNLYLLLLVIAIAVNSVLILGFQALFVYTITDPVTNQSVLTLDEAYEDCTITDHKIQDSLESWLLESPAGTYKLVTVEKHSFLDRYRIVKNGTRALETGSYSDRIMTDTAFLTIGAENGAFSDWSTTGIGFHMKGLACPLYFIVFSAVLIVLEILAYCLFNKLRS